MENSGEGKGQSPSAFMFWHLWEAQCYLGTVCPLALSGLINPFCALSPPKSPLPLSHCGSIGNCHIGGIPVAWAPADAVWALPARAPQLEPPTPGLSHRALCGAAPSWLLPNPESSGGFWVSSRWSLKSRPLDVRLFQVPRALCDTGGQDSNWQMIRVTNPVLYLHRTWAYSSHINVTPALVIISPLLLQ